MITLQQLRYFSELAKTEQLTRTAEKLCISQTTLSNTIRSLEQQLGVSLFERSGRGIRLSGIGRKYLEYVDTALKSLGAGQDLVNDFRQSKMQTVSVIITSSQVFAGALEDFAARYPAYTVRKIDCGQEQFLLMLQSHETDYLIAGEDDVSLSGLSYQILREEKLFLCVAREHRFADRKGIRLEEARQEAFINLPRSIGFRGFCDRLFRQAGFVPKTALECDYTLRGRLISEGYGIAIATQITKDKNILGDDEKIAYIPILDSFARRRIVIIWNPKHSLGQAALEFKDYIIGRQRGAR